jgi:uncharacterized membrane protein
VYTQRFASIYYMHMKKEKTLQGTWHDTYMEASSFADKVADTVADFVGSWTFLFLHSIWFFIWIFFNVEDFPFGLLTMIVSLEAIFLATFIMISQNRLSDRDRHQALRDLQTDIKAKNEIEKIGAALLRIEDEKLDKIIKLLSK